MNRSGGGSPFEADPVSGVLGDPSKRSIAAQILGQGYVTAHNVARQNRAGIDTIADALEARLEIMGDELLVLLERANLKVPEFDLADEDAWPPAEFAAARVGGPSQQPALPAPSPSQNGAPTT